MLTPRQKEILDFITSYIDQKGYGPTLTEISDHFNLGSASAAHQHVATLQRKGFLRKLPNQTRAISINDKTEELEELPLVGRIALGEPIENFDDPRTVKVPKFLLSGQGTHYALEAMGNSMNKDGILDGDILLIKQTNLADNGDIVVAQVVNYGATLKRFYNSGSKIELRPKSSDPEYKPQLYDFGMVEVQGKFCGLMRRSQ